MINIDLYSEPFDQSNLESVYKYFNGALSNPQPKCDQTQLRAQSLTNERQRVIRVDCLRTRSPNFTQPLKNQLQILLTHYCRINEIKYKQGLNEIASPFLYFRKLGISIAKCEALFHSFFKNYCLNFYDDDTFSSVELFIKMFSVVLKYHDPGLSRYLQWHNIQPQLFCINWLMTLFASKLSLKLVYLLWSYITAERDKFLLFFLILAIVEINRQNIIQSKNNNVLQVVTDLIFKDIQSLQSVIERALLIRKNTPSSIVLFFRDRRIFQKRQRFADISRLLQHIQKLNLFVILPGEMTLDKHLSRGSCQNQCYFCDLGKSLRYNQQNCSSDLIKLIQTSNDIRLMNYRKQYVIMDLRMDQSNEINFNGPLFKVKNKQTIQQIQYRFMKQFMEEKGKKHFVIVLTTFSFQDLNLCIAQQFQKCKQIIKILNSASFPLLSILQGGFDAYQQNQINQQKLKTLESVFNSADSSIICQNFTFPFTFPLKIKDRCSLGSALCNNDVTAFIGLVQAIIIADFYIFILPIQKNLLSFINYFQHNKSIIQYLYERPHVPQQLLVHKIISIGRLKKGSIKIHNQNILVLLYDSCVHQQRRIFNKIYKYLQIDTSKYCRLEQICQNCQMKKNKIILEMKSNQSVRECLQVLTKRYKQIRKKIRFNEQSIL